MSTEILEELRKRPPRTLDCPVLVTERLVLRAPNVEDMDAIADLANNRNVSAMLQSVPFPFTRKHAAEYILRSVAGEMGYCAYAITKAEDGAFIGACHIKDREEGEGLSLRYWIGKPYWNMGYATEAVGSLIDAAFRATDIDALYVSNFAANKASRRVIEKQGFEYIGTSEQNSLVSGLVIADNYILEREKWIGQLSKCA